MKLNRRIPISRLLLMISALSVSYTQAQSEARNKAIQERIKPAGEVCIEGNSCASGSIVAAKSVGVARTGQQIYDKHCQMCHAQGVAGAPKTFDKAAWASRLAKGMDVVYSNVMSGIGAMPAKGLCMDCSDDEIKASVRFIIGDN